MFHLHVFDFVPNLGLVFGGTIHDEIVSELVELTITDRLTLTACHSILDYFITRLIDSNGMPTHVGLFYT